MYIYWTRIGAGSIFSWRSSTALQGNLVWWSTSLNQSMCQGREIYCPPSCCEPPQRTINRKTLTSWMVAFLHIPVQFNLWACPVLSLHLCTTGTVFQSQHHTKRTQYPLSNTRPPTTYILLSFTFLYKQWHKFEVPQGTTLEWTINLVQGVTMRPTIQAHLIKLENKQAKWKTSWIHWENHWNRELVRSRDDKDWLVQSYLPAIGRFLIVVTFIEDALRIITQWNDQLLYLKDFRHSKKHSGVKRPV